MAEREGFEPPVPVKARPLSRRVHSTTLPPLRPTTVLLQSSIFPEAEAFCSLCFQGIQACEIVGARTSPPKSSTEDPGTGFRFGSPRRASSFAALWKNGGVARKRWQGWANSGCREVSDRAGKHTLAVAQTLSLVPYWFVDCKMGAKRCEFGT